MKSPGIPLALLVAALSASASARLSKVRSPGLSPDAPPALSPRDLNTLEPTDPHPPTGAATILPQDPTKTHVHDFDVNPNPSAVLNNPALSTEVSENLPVDDGTSGTSLGFEQCADASGAQSCKGQGQTSTPAQES